METDVIRLSKAYTCRYGAPVIREVESAIFVKGYFGDCMACDYCHDVCCSHGADVTAIDREQMANHAAALERHTGRPQSDWFNENRDLAADWPGGWATRIRAEDGHCLFLNTNGRGCLIHDYALRNGVEVHTVKPMVCLLWPVTWLGETLRVSNELRDDPIICAGPGQTCYRSARSDIAYYFGPELVAELDALELTVGSNQSPSDRPTIPLSLVQPHG